MRRRPPNVMKKWVAVRQPHSPEAPPSPLSSRPEKSWAVGPTQADEKWIRFGNHTQWKRRPPLCHLDRRSHGQSSPPKLMKNGFGSATTLNGSAALPFVISTGAPKERSGEICGFSGPFLGMFFDRRSHGQSAHQGDEKWVRSGSHTRWKRRPPLHRKSGAVQWRDLQFSEPFLEMFSDKACEKNGHSSFATRSGSPKIRI
jgi:hypothetical protein